MNFLRLPDVTARTGLTRSRLYALMAEGQFPPPVRIGVRAVAWASDEVEAWLKARLAERGPWAGAPAAIESRADRMTRPSNLSQRA